MAPEQAPTLPRGRSEQDPNAADLQRTPNRAKTAKKTKTKTVSGEARRTIPSAADDRPKTSEHNRSEPNSRNGSGARRSPPPPPPAAEAEAKAAASPARSSAETIFSVLFVSV